MSRFVFWVRIPLETQTKKGALRFFFFFMATGHLKLSRGPRLQASELQRVEEACVGSRQQTSRLAQDLRHTRRGGRLVWGTRCGTRGTRGVAKRGAGSWLGLKGKTEGKTGNFGQHPPMAGQLPAHRFWTKRCHFMSK